MYNNNRTTRRRNEPRRKRAHRRHETYGGRARNERTKRCRTTRPGCNQSDRSGEGGGHGPRTRPHRGPVHWRSAIDAHTPVAGTRPRLPPPSAWTCQNNRRLCVRATPWRGRFLSFHRHGPRRAHRRNDAEKPISLSSCAPPPNRSSLSTHHSCHLTPLSQTYGTTFGAVAICVPENRVRGIPHARRTPGIQSTDDNIFRKRFSFLYIFRI